MEKFTVNSADWMSRVSGEKLITEINIPGTHDSLARFVAFSPITQTQSKTLREQLECGVRYFDLRLIKKKDDIIAAHGGVRCRENCSIFSSSLTAKTVADSCIEFLEKHPGETVLFQLKADVNGSWDTLYSEFYNDVIKGNESRWYLENRVPALDEARGKVVMLRAVAVEKELFDEKNCGIDFSRYPYIGSKELYDFRLESVADLNGKEYTKMYVQDSYKIQMKKKWTAVKGFLESDLDKNNFNICLLSCTGSFQPYLNAKYINKIFMDYCLDKNKVYGIIAADFITEDICKKIFETNN